MRTRRSTDALHSLAEILLHRRRDRHARGRFGRRRLRSATTIAVVLLAALATARLVGEAAALRSAYGTRRRLPVARADLLVGHVVGAEDVDWRDLPVALVPSGASPDPVGRTVRAPIMAAEVMVDQRLYGSAAAGPAGLMEGSERAVAIERDALTPAVRPGDRVDLLGGGARAATAPLARRARVLAVDERSVLVAVTATEAVPVARAALDRTMLMALVGGG
ncbi:MAG: hypothetical protein KGR18_02815 [Acidobacteria bacterium]|nr:hypothetical protein [Acidobacteriota bacterium]